MSRKSLLDQDRLSAKIASIGGLKAMFGRSGYDFYASLAIASVYTALLLLGIIPSDWMNLIPVLAGASLGLVAIMISTLIGIHNFRSKVMENQEFNRRIERGKFINAVLFYFDYSYLINLLFVLTFAMFAVLTIISWRFISMQADVSAVFSITIFFGVYSVGTFLFMLKAYREYELLRLHHG